MSHVYICLFSKKTKLKASILSQVHELSMIFKVWWEPKRRAASMDRCYLIKKTNMFTVMNHQSTALYHSS